MSEKKIFSVSTMLRLMLLGWALAAGQADHVKADLVHVYEAMSTISEMGQGNGRSDHEEIAKDPTYSTRNESASGDISSQSLARSVRLYGAVIGAACSAAYMYSSSNKGFMSFKPHHIQDCIAFSMTAVVSPRTFALATGVKIAAAAGVLPNVELYDIAKLFFAKLALGFVPLNMLTALPPALLIYTKVIAISGLTCAAGYAGSWYLKPYLPETVGNTKTYMEDCLAILVTSASSPHRLAFAITAKLIMPSLHLRHLLKINMAIGAFDFVNEFELAAKILRPVINAGQRVKAGLSSAARAVSGSVSRMFRRKKALPELE